MVWLYMMYVCVQLLNTAYSLSGLTRRAGQVYALLIKELNKLNLDYAL